MHTVSDIEGPPAYRLMFQDVHLDPIEDWDVYDTREAAIPPLRPIPALTELLAPALAPRRHPPSGTEKETEQWLTP